MVLHLNKLEFPSPKDAFCQVWLKLAQWFWRRRWKCENVPTTTTTTDNGHILIRKAHLSLRLRSAKNWSQSLSDEEKNLMPTALMICITSTSNSFQDAWN